MSFGDGNLHAKCEQYKRQVGGLTAALNRARRENEELRALARDVFNGWQQTEIDRAIRNGSNDARTPELVGAYERMKELGVEI